jgi:poly(hydroxyalkanoate) depolymerase family esterase
MRLIPGLVFGIVMLSLAATAQASITPVPSFGANPGALDMFEYVPGGLPSGRPLVVVMHGCTQTAAAMEAAGWNTLAETYQFAVVYPQQRSANQALSCFNWYSAADEARDGGEPASIIAMVDTMIATHGSDRARVYVTGLSAGAAFTSIMMATYPDRFQAGSIMAGLPFKCATTVNAASACQQMSSGSQKTPAQWGDLVRGARPGYAGSWPRVQIWQGTADFTVYPANAAELVDQWTDVWGTDQTADATETISTATRTQFVAGSTVAVEVYMIDGMGHAIVTGTDAMGPCPATTGTYFADKKVCSTLRAAAFFGLLADGGGGSGSGSGSGSGDGDDQPGDDPGGCSTTHGGAPASLAIALAFVLSRRRRSRYRF